LPIVLEDERDFESYLAKLEGRLAAGHACDRCRSARLRGHGSYERPGFLLAAGVEVTLPIRRVRCLDCGRAPSLVPAFAAAGFRSAERVVEEGVARYLGPPEATYRRVAAWLGSAHSTVHRWASRLGGLGLALLMELLLRLRPDLDPLALLPKTVAAEERKAKSPERRDLLRRALGVLALGRRCAEELARGVAGAPPTAFTLVRVGFAT
jgi:hypothetical protein